MSVILINAVLYIIKDPMNGDIVMHTGTQDSCEQFIESYYWRQSNDAFDAQAIVNHPY